jgi:hypothetical protein
MAKSRFLEKELNEKVGFTKSFFNYLNTLNIHYALIANSDNLEDFRDVDILTPEESFLDFKDAIFSFFKKNNFDFFTNLEVKVVRVGKNSKVIRYMFFRLEPFFYYPIDILTTLNTFDIYYDTAYLLRDLSSERVFNEKINAFVLSATVTAFLMIRKIMRINSLFYYRLLEGTPGSVKNYFINKLGKYINHINDRLILDSKLNKILNFRYKILGKMLSGSLLKRNLGALHMIEILININGLLFKSIFHFKEVVSFFLDRKTLHLTKDYIVSVYCETRKQKTDFLLFLKKLYASYFLFSYKVLDNNTLKPSEFSAWKNVKRVSGYFYPLIKFVKDKSKADLIVDSFITDKELVANYLGIYSKLSGIKMGTL